MNVLGIRFEKPARFSAVVVFVFCVSVMYPLWERITVPQPADNNHDYMCASPPRLVDVCVQTDLTAADISTLQELARKLFGVTPPSPESDSADPDSKELLRGAFSVTTDVFYHIYNLSAVYLKFASGSSLLTQR